MSETNKIYVDIESLLDLRQGLLFETVEDTEALIEYLLSNDYNYRDVDQFSLVEDEVYKKAHANMTKSILPASSLSHIISPVRSKILSMEKMTGMYTDNKRVELVLNTYPLELTHKEAEHIQNLLFVKLQAECLISVVRIEPKQLSPSYIKRSGFAAIFIYDFTTWINLHTKQLESVDIKEVTIYFPALQQKSPTKEDLKKIKEIGFNDMFSYTEFLLSRFLNISFLPVVFYSNLVTTAIYLKDLDDSLKEEKLDEVDLTDVELPEV